MYADTRLIVVLVVESTSAVNAAVPEIGERIDPRGRHMQSAAAIAFREKATGIKWLLVLPG
jgi:hypothetical protein